MTQNKQLIAIFESGRSLTPLQALNEVGSMKLATRVGEIKALGYKIKDRWIDDRLTGKKYKAYWMENNG